MKKTLKLSLTYLLVFIFLFQGMTYAAPSITSGPGSSVGTDEWTMDIGVGVKASFDGTAKTLTISGNGQISNSLWMEMARKINSKNYTETSNSKIKLGSAWGGEDSFDIIFKNTGSNKIKISPAFGNKGGMFEGFCGDIHFNGVADVSGVKNFNYTFKNAQKFNSDISDWDMTSAVELASMFEGAKAFNSDISSWRFPNARSTSSMFRYARSFNQDLNEWTMASVTDPRNMFDEATSFNGDISAWDTSSMISMESMFEAASSFNRDIDAWDVSSVIHFNHMFWKASSFNQDLSSWKIGDKYKSTNIGDQIYGMKNTLISFNGIRMNNMFDSASSFNGDISTWDMSKVVTTFAMFQNASAFNSDISKWDMSTVEDSSHMFQNASSFDQDLSKWDMRSSKNMVSMFNSAVSLRSEDPTFYGENARNNFSNWNTSSVKKMRYMFKNTPNMKYISIGERGEDIGLAESLNIFLRTRADHLRFARLEKFGTNGMASHQIGRRKYYDAWVFPYRYKIEYMEDGENKVEYRNPGESYVFKAGVEYDMTRVIRHKIEFKIDGQEPFYTVDEEELRNPKNWDKDDGTGGPSTAPFIIKNIDKYREEAEKKFPEGLKLNDYEISSKSTNLPYRLEHDESTDDENIISIVYKKKGSSSGGGVSSDTTATSSTTTPTSTTKGKTSTSTATETSDSATSTSISTTTIGGKIPSVIIDDTIVPRKIALDDIEDTSVVYIKYPNDPDNIVRIDINDVPKGFFPTVQVTNNGEQVIIFDTDIPESGLPNAGGLPFTLLFVLGVLILGIGLYFKKRIA